MSRRSVLILEDGFLKPREGKQLHGVELFRLGLMRDLLARGVSVSVIAERSWQPVFAEHCSPARTGGATPNVITAPGLRWPLLTGILGASFVVGERYDTVLFGNARKGLAPAMHLISMMQIADRMVLFAHREPGPSFLELVSSIPFDTVANSEMIARHYRGLTSGRVDVCYGINHADRFFPSDRQTNGRDADDGLINFALLAKLPNKSKGLQRALECFERLPADLRARSRLHLASFTKDTELAVPGVVVHKWLASDAVGQFLRHMDVMLCLSKHETFSQAIVQGMLTQLPIIATPLPVYVEKLDTGAGVVCMDDDSIVRTMTELALNAQQRVTMGQAGRATALDRYVWNTDFFIERYLFPHRIDEPNVHVTPAVKNHAESSRRFS